MNIYMNNSIPYIYFYFVGVLIPSVIYDLRYQRIPNWLNFTTFILAVLYHTMSNGLPGFLFAMEGSVAGVLLLILPFLMGGVGAGDAKLLGAVGGLLGPLGVFVAFLVSALVGGIYAVALLLYCGKLGTTLRRYGVIIKTGLLTKKITYIPPSVSEKCPRLRYGVAIALGAIISVLMKETIYEILHLN